MRKACATNWRATAHAADPGKLEEEVKESSMRVSVFLFVWQKDDAMQPQTKDEATTKIKARRTRGFKPQAEANSSSKGSVGHASETGKP